MVHLSVEAMADGKWPGQAIRSGMGAERRCPAGRAEATAGHRRHGLGTTAHAPGRQLPRYPVWWSEADGRVYVFVGADDEVRGRGRHNPALYRPRDPRTRREGAPALTPPGTTATATSPQDKRLTRSCPARPATAGNFY